MPGIPYSVTCFCELDDCKDGTKEQNRMLIESIGTGNMKQFRRALDSGADVNVKGRYDFSPLMFAVMLRRRKMMKILLDSGADVNARNCDGFTALMLAASGTPAVIRLLLNAGADRNLRDHQGRTALRIAGIFNNSAATGIL